MTKLLFMYLVIALLLGFAAFLFIKWFNHYLDRDDQSIRILHLQTEMDIYKSALFKDKPLIQAALDYVEYLEMNDLAGVKNGMILTRLGAFSLVEAARRFLGRPSLLAKTEVPVPAAKSKLSNQV